MDIDTDWSRGTRQMRNQGEDFGVCWAIAVAGLVEATFNLSVVNEQEQIMISPQDIIDNYFDDDIYERLRTAEKPSEIVGFDVGPFDDKGGFGLHSQRALDWVRIHGCVTELNCPFVWEKQPNTTDREAEYTFSWYCSVRNIWNALHYGPVIAYITVTPELKDLHADEIYYGPATNINLEEIHENHCVLVVGRKTVKDGGIEKKYFIIKNSWGESWANGGYGKISCEPYTFWKTNEAGEDVVAKIDLLTEGMVIHNVHRVGH